MLKILIDFLINFSNKVFTKKNMETLKKDIYIRNIIKLLIEYTELYDTINSFQKHLVQWKNEGFIGYIDYNFFTQVNSILNEIQETYSKLQKLLIVSDYELFESISYSLDIKINVFTVWNIISDFNEKNYDLYDRQKKILILPNYSFLLDVKPVSFLSKNDKEIMYQELSNKIEKNVIENLFENILSFSNFKSDRFKESIQYFPAIPNECEVICLPDDAEKIDKIINVTKKASDMLREQIEKLRGIMYEFVGNNKEDIIKYL